MLELRGIQKEFHSRNGQITVLDDVNLSFRTKEFVVILGTNGSGKSTLLNIISGELRPTCGTVLFRGEELSAYNSAQIESFRNQNVGYLHQKVPMIQEKTLLENIRLPMDTSGIEDVKAENRALKLITMLGLIEYADSDPTELSHGLLKKAGLARALVNNPDILVCDEPTEGLDAENADEFMAFLKEESEKRLVIIVTQNLKLADKYADRILYMENGKVINDTNPFHMDPVLRPLMIRKKGMNPGKVIKNAWELFRKDRVQILITVIACCFGIGAFILALSLAGGFRTATDRYEASMMEQYPIIITSGDMQVRADTQIDPEEEDLLPEYTEENVVYPYDPKTDFIQYHNNISDEFMMHMQNIGSDICEEIEYVQRMSMNPIRKADDGSIIPVSIAKAGTLSDKVESAADLSLAAAPETINDDNEIDRTSYLRKYYDAVYGTFPEKPEDLCICIDSKNRLDLNVLKNLGIDPAERESIDYTELVGMELKRVPNNDYYVRQSNGLYAARTDYETLYQGENNTDLRIVGIIRPKKSEDRALLRNGIIYQDSLCSLVADESVSSEIVIAQRSSQMNVISGEPLDDKQKEDMILALAGDPRPIAIILYSKDLESKSEICKYIDDYNERAENMIVYTDLAGQEVSNMTSMFSGILHGAKIISVLTSISCIILVFVSAGYHITRRKREIGIWRTFGVMKKNIRSIYVLWSGLYGLALGLGGVLMGFVMSFPVNLTVSRYLNMESVISVHGRSALITILFCIVLAVIAGILTMNRLLREEPAEMLRKE